MSAITTSLYNLWQFYKFSPKQHLEENNRK